MQLYKIVQLNEEEKNVDKLRLRLRYWNNAADSPRVRNNVRAEVHHQSLYVDSDEIPILKSATQTLQKHVKAVTVFSKPWTLEREDFYDPSVGSCRAGLICSKPTMKDKEIVYKKTCCTGFIIDLFVLVLKHTNFEYTLYVVEDGKYGGIGEDGKWNGMIGDLVIDKADIAIAALTLTKSRAEVVNFTLQFFDDRLGIVYRPHWSAIEFINFHFVSMVSSNLKMTLLFMVIGTVFVIYLFENTVYKIGLPALYDTVKSYYNLYESMTYIGGVTLQRDLGGVLPNRYGARLTAIIFAFSMVVFVTTFTALLAANRIENVEDMPFTGSSDPRMRNPTSKFKFGTVKDTSYHTRFQLSNNDVIKRISQFMDNYNVLTEEEAIRKVANGELQAFIYHYTMLTWIVQNDNLCELKVLQEKLFEGMASFAMNKNFKWSEIVNEAIHHYHYKTNEISRIYKKWFPSGCSHRTDATPLAINDFGGLIFILCVVAVASIPFLIPEHFYRRYRSQRFKLSLLEKR